MGTHTKDFSCWPLNGRLLLVRSLLLITSLTPKVLGSPAYHGATTSARKLILAKMAAPGFLDIGPTLEPRRGPADYPIAQLNTTWVNSDSPGGGAGVQFIYGDGTIVRPLLLRGSSGPSFACGFFCRGSCNATLFSIFLVVTDSTSAISDASSGFPQVVWSANRNKPVGEGALLQLTSDGRLVLSDSVGNVVWSTDTVGKNVSGVKLTETGNLVLHSSTGETVWQSFDHATDTVLPDQSVAGQILIANFSATNSSEGRFYLRVTNESLHAFIDSVDMREMYYSQLQGIKEGKLLPREGRTDGIRSAYDFVRLERDGHLKQYVWSTDESIWKAEKDLLTKWSSYNECDYPAVCGEYGICSPPADESWPQCSCPKGREGEVDYFQPEDDRKLNRGCFPSVNLTCQSPKAHFLLRQDNIRYFGYVQAANLVDTDVESCKNACLGNCFCKAAFFKFGHDGSRGDCYLPSRLLSLRVNQNDVTGYNSSAFIKVQISPEVDDTGGGGLSRVVGSILGATLFALILLGVVAGVVVLRRRRRRRRRDEEEVEECLPHLPGMPARFSYGELKAATGNFSTLLGEGGFGSVFLGTLADGMIVAVKLLGGKRQGKKEFLAEVETIGSIHHVNLVRLVGYCAHKLHRLLVYEYMCNGSLDKWVFHRDDDNPRSVDWQTRHKIMLHVAKGLAYLHEDCRHRIAHLDIKPENILLDEGFNAKVSDFGLSKLIDRDQSQVLTTMRGTPGYLAPEWLSSMITEKVDIYSFGVVVLETVCGRRNIDGSRPKQTLVNEAKSAVENDRVLHIVDRNCAGIEYYLDEAIKMVRTALWCLQVDPDTRPPMSIVVKVLEGVMEPVLDSNFAPLAQVMDHREVCSSSSTSTTVASTLSGPR